jgi:hypothetical protein
MKVVVLRPRPWNHFTTLVTKKCPYCGSALLPYWGAAAKTNGSGAVYDTRSRTHRCQGCSQVFTGNGDGHESAVWTLQMRRLAALTWLLGHSSREVQQIFNELGTPVSHSTIWRDGKNLMELHKAREGIDHLSHMKFVKGYISLFGGMMWVGVGIELENGKRSFLGVVNERDPRVVIHCLKEFTGEQTQMYVTDTAKVPVVEKVLA